MSKFNVGDRVRVTSDLYATFRGRLGEPTPLVGDVGVVTGEATVGANFYVIVRLDRTTCPTNGMDDGWRFGEGDVELIEGGSTVRKIAIGDRVRVIGESLEALRVEHDDHTIDAVGVVKGRNDAYDTWLVLLDDDDLRSPYSIEGTWAVEDSDVEHVDDAAKSIEVEVAAALVGDDRPARNGAMIDVDGETLDVEAMFYRMCAATTKRTRRRKAS